MPTLVQNGKAKRVKNLGWLMRNVGQVKDLRVKFYFDRTLGKDTWEGGFWLIANLDCGGAYSVQFADATVLSNFTNRRVFRHLTKWC